MKVTANDFSGYNESCLTIKEIKLWIEQEKNGSFELEDLIKTFKEKVWQLEAKILEYINPKYVREYLKILGFHDFTDSNLARAIIESKNIIQSKAEQFGSVKTVEDLINRERSLESEYRSKQNWLDIEIEKYSDFKNFDELVELKERLKAGWDYQTGTVIQVLNYFFQQSFNPQPYNTTNQVMYCTLSNLCQIAKFDEDDFSKVVKKFNFSYWGGAYIESFYKTAITSNNNSAWKSIEKFLDRKPFILNNRRMYEGIKFEAIEDSKRVYYRCTGWNDKKEIKFVTEHEEKQRRFSFDNKDFKSFFKSKKITF